MKTIIEITLMIIMIIVFLWGLNSGIKLMIDGYYKTKK